MTIARIRLHLALAALWGTLSACGDIPSAASSVSAETAVHQTSSALDVSISGTDYIFEQYDTFTWTANTTGGTGPYSYQWQIRFPNQTNFTNAGTGSTYSREVNYANHPSFTLRVTVTANGESAVDEHFVEVQGPPMCGGVYC